MGVSDVHSVAEHPAVQPALKQKYESSLGCQGPNLLMHKIPIDYACISPPSIHLVVLMSTNGVSTMFMVNINVHCQRPLIECMPHIMSKVQ